MLEKPKNDVRLTDTCQGHRPKAALLPPTMRVSGRVKTGTPHSVTERACIIQRLRFIRTPNENSPLRAADTVFMMALLLPSALSPISFDSMTLRLLDGRDCSADGVDTDDDDDAEDDTTVLVVVVYGRDDEVGLCVVFVGKTPAEDIVVVTGFVA